MYDVYVSVNYDKRIHHGISHLTKYIDVSPALNLLDFFFQVIESQTNKNSLSKNRINMLLYFQDKTSLNAFISICIVKNAH